MMPTVPARPPIPTPNPDPNPPQKHQKTPKDVPYGVSRRRGARACLFVPRCGGGRRVRGVRGKVDEEWPAGAVDGGEPLDRLVPDHRGAVAPRVVSGRESGKFDGQMVVQKESGV